MKTKHPTLENNIKILYLDYKHGQKANMSMSPHPSPSISPQFSDIRALTDFLNKISRLKKKFADEMQYLQWMETSQQKWQ